MVKYEKREKISRKNKKDIEYNGVIEGSPVFFYFTSYFYYLARKICNSTFTLRTMYRGFNKI